MTVITSIPQIVPIPNKYIKDLTGQRYGRLLVLGYVGIRLIGKRNRNSRWLCICDCKTHIVVNNVGLHSGHTKSCGCYAREITAQIGKANLRHGMEGTPEWKAWSSLRNRCENPNNRAYSHYGGRGIKVCDRWQKFENFFSDIGPRPSPKHSIDRRDNEGNYCPENARWATRVEQANNRRSNLHVVYQGISHTIAEWSDIIGIDQRILYGRISQNHWSIERAFTTPVRRFMNREIIRPQLEFDTKR